MPYAGSPRAGGLAVIAHPARYKFTANEEYALFSEFRAHGGRASRWTGKPHRRRVRDLRAAMAEEFGLAASRGSDFHSPDESHTDLGTCPTCRATSPHLGNAGRPRAARHLNPSTQQALPWHSISKSTPTTRSPGCSQAAALLQRAASWPCPPIRAMPGLPPGRQGRGRPPAPHSPGG